MKTYIKIFLLIIFTIGAIAGVLVFAKTRVSPPSNISMVDQYSDDLKSEYESFTTLKDFSQCRTGYLRLDDKLNRFFIENAIDAETSDDYRKKIDETYGNALVEYSFDIFQKREWPEDKLKELSAMLASLESDKLTDGKKAVNANYIKSAKQINTILVDYYDALRLSKSTSFTGIGDASTKISKAERYSSAEYLRNNSLLTNALHELPKKLAQSHYNHVSGIVNALGNYYYVDKDYYVNTLIQRAENAISDFKTTKIYGASKLDLSDVENRAENLVTQAMNFYTNQNN